MLRVAVPNKGTLSEPAAAILSEAGYRRRTDAKDLTVSQAALLAGIIPSPNNWDPAVSPTKSSISRQRAFETPTCGASVVRCPRPVRPGWKLDASSAAPTSCAGRRICR